MTTVVSTVRKQSSDLPIDNPSPQRRRASIAAMLGVALGLASVATEAAEIRYFGSGFARINVALSGNVNESVFTTLSDAGLPSAWFAGGRKARVRANLVHTSTSAVLQQGQGASSVASVSAFYSRINGVLPVWREPSGQATTQVFSNSVHNHTAFGTQSNSLSFDVQTDFDVARNDSLSFFYGVSQDQNTLAASLDGQIRLSFHDNFRLKGGESSLIPWMLNFVREKSSDNVDKDQIRFVRPKNGGPGVRADATFEESSRIQMQGMRLFEASPAHIYYDFDFSQLMQLDPLEFSFLWEDVGDGDLFTISYQLEGSSDFVNLFTSFGLNFQAGDLVNEMIDLSALAGLKGTLAFDLQSTGDSNASIFIPETFSLVSNAGSGTGGTGGGGSVAVPAPGSALLLGLGLIALGRRRAARMCPPAR